MEQYWQEEIVKSKGTYLDPHFRNNIFSEPLIGMYVGVSVSTQNKKRAVI